jgi:hypothetical protein
LAGASGASNAACMVAWSRGEERERGFASCERAASGAHARRRPGQQRFRLSGYILDEGLGHCAYPTLTAQRVQEVLHTHLDTAHRLLIPCHQVVKRQRVKCHVAGARQLQEVYLTSVPCATERGRPAGAWTKGRGPTRGPPCLRAKAAARPGHSGGTPAIRSMLAASSPCSQAALRCGPDACPRCRTKAGRASGASRAPATGRDAALRRSPGRQNQCLSGRRAAPRSSPAGLC